jgi:hypothetical protein
MVSDIPQIRQISLHGYVDSYWADSVVDRKSTSRCCFSLGSVVSACFSRKKTSVALSMTEAEYIIAFLAIKEDMRLINFLAGLFNLELETTCILCDN